MGKSVRHELVVAWIAAANRIVTSQIEMCGLSLLGSGCRLVENRDTTWRGVLRHWELWIEVTLVVLNQLCTTN